MSMCFIGEPKIRCQSSSSCLVEQLARQMIFVAAVSTESEREGNLPGASNIASPNNLSITVRSPLAPVPILPAVFATSRSDPLVNRKLDAR